jgi:UPF0755 protein
MAGSPGSSDRYPSGAYDSGDSWGGDDSFMPGFDGQDDAPRGRRGRGRDTGRDSVSRGDPGRGDPGRDASGRGAGGRNGAALDNYGDDYADDYAGDYGDGYDDPRDSRGRGGARDSDYGDYDHYDSRDNVRVQKGKRKRGPIRRLAPWIAVVIILLIIGIPGYIGYSKYMSRYHPPDFSGAGTSPTVTVEVPQSATATSLGPMLVQDGVVASSRALILAAENGTDKSSLEPGTYKLNTHMQASLAYAALLNPKNRVQLAFTLKEGQRVAQVIASLSKLMNVPVSQFETIVGNPSQLGLPSYANPSVSGVSSSVIGYKVEGFLWPATYNVQPHETPLQVLQGMVAKYNQTVQQQNLTAAAKTRGLSLYDVLIEASMVQAEAGNKPQMPKIASVIKNRFSINMPLQFDSVLQYGQNSFALNIKDGQSSIPGPYNDFLNTKLPPTPISNPGLDAIDAVLHPASTNYLYFLAQPNGSSLFCVHQPASATATQCPPNG